MGNGSAGDSASGPAIWAAGLNVTYGEDPVVLDADLSVMQGKITALIGPSGCGKSALLRALAGAPTPRTVEAVTGDVKVMGRQERDQVTLVPQLPVTLPLSIRDNVLFGYRLDEQRRELPSASTVELEEMLLEPLAQVGLWNDVRDRLDQPAAALSVPQQQQLAIARVALRPTQVILLDDPCALLPQDVRYAVEEVFWQLRRAHTIVFSTSHMALARRASDRCLFMERGRIVEDSRTGDMFVTPKSVATAQFLEGRVR